MTADSNALKTAGLPDDCDEAQLRALILDLTGEYARRFHAPKPFVPGQSAVPVSGKVYGESDMRSLVDSALDFWLTTGRFNDQFEAQLAECTDPAQRETLTRLLDEAFRELAEAEAAKRCQASR